TRVERAGQRRRHLQPEVPGEIDPGQRAKEGVHALADAVAGRGRAQQRREDVGPRLHAPDAERDAEVVLAVRQSLALGEVDDAADAERRVGDDTGDVVRAAPEAALQEIVADDHRLAEVGDEVVDREAEHTWRQRLVEAGDRQEILPTGLHADGEELAVPRLERVARRLASRRLAPRRLAPRGLAPRGLAHRRA